MNRMFSGSKASRLKPNVHLGVLKRGVIGYALWCSRDLQEYLSRYLRYQHLLCPQLQAHLEVVEEGACLGVRPVSGLWQLDQEGTCQLLQEWLAGWRWRRSLVRDGGSLFECVELDFAAPSAASAELWKKRLGCEVRFACRETRGIFPVELLRRPLTCPDGVIRGFHREESERLLQTLARRSDLVMKINRLLVSHIGPLPAMEAIAARLCVSVRTLHRHLQREGTSYQQLVIDYRLALAKRYLVETSLPANEIAGLVGYADTANFYRTFRHAEGVTPRQYRTEANTGTNIGEQTEMEVIQLAQGIG